MGNLTLTKPSQPQCTDSPLTLDSLISEWVAKLAINAGAALDVKTQAVYKALWIEGLGDLPADVLLTAFLRTLRECPYWPVKVADIRKHVDRTKESALAEAADLEWQRVLDLRRQYWSPDAPGGFWPGMPKLSDRVRAACRACGVFRDFTSAEFEKGELHTWAKKRFVESYLAWETLQQDQFLLPDGELKNLLADFAQAKALPAPRVDWQELRERGESYRAETATPGESLAKPARETPRVIDFEGRAAELQRQAEIIRQKYPEPGNSAGIPPELRPVEMEA